MCKIALFREYFRQAANYTRRVSTAGALVEVKHEKETLEDRLLCTICMEADAPRTWSSGRATTSSPAPRAPPRSPSAPTVARRSLRVRRSRTRASA